MNAKDQYRRAVDVLRAGGVVAMPTDTVYGLIAVAADDAAVRRLYEIKQRDLAQPLPLFVGSLDQARLIAETSAAVNTLAAAFWPGALTVVLPLRASYRTLAASGGDTIGLRVPDDAALREIALQLGPLTGTSANLHGQPECHSAADVGAQLGGAVDLIVNAPGPAGGVPSTVIDLTDPDLPRIVREGAVTREAIDRVVSVASS